MAFALAAVYAVWDATASEEAAEQGKQMSF